MRATKGQSEYTPEKQRRLKAFMNLWSRIAGSVHWLLPCIYDATAGDGNCDQSGADPSPKVLFECAK